MYVTVTDILQPQMEQPPVKIIKDPQSDEPAEPRQNVLSQLLKYSFKYTSQVQHDFTKSRYASIIAYFWRIPHRLKICAALCPTENLDGA